LTFLEKAGDDHNRLDTAVDRIVTTALLLAAGAASIRMELV
jgi:hypothetical protein